MIEVAIRDESISSSDMPETGSGADVQPVAPAVGIMRSETIGEAWRRAKEETGFENPTFERQWVQMEPPKILPIYDPSK